MNFYKILETKFRFCFYEYWNLYAADAKRNALFELVNAVMESERVSDLFENIGVKITFIHCKQMEAEQTYFEICSG